jgi:hypothetical protein
MMQKNMVFISLMKVNTLKGVLMLCILGYSGLGCSINREFMHFLEGETIRSFAINNENADQILIGLKGEGPGKGKVYLSVDAGDTWKATNSGNALSAESEDVQAVAFIDSTNFLAGTWKNGMFRSRTKGKTWEPYSQFPSKDVRAIKVSAKESQNIYAATTTSWILKLAGPMNNWEQLKRKRMANWDLIVDPANEEVLYALTFKQGVQMSKDGGSTWEQVIAPNHGIMFYDLAISVDGEIVAVGSDTKSGVIKISKDGGDNWKNMTDIPLAELNSVELVNGKIIVGSWDKGVHEYSNGVWSYLPEIKSDAITKIKKSDRYIYYFTWGNGIFREKYNEAQFVKSKSE